MKQDLVMLVGLACLVSGVALFSYAAGLIVLGTLLIIWAYVTARPEPPRAV